jgi:cutinase
VCARQIAGFLGAAVSTWALLNTAISIPSAAAAPCPDIEVVFARGTAESPGIGWAGNAFVDSLRSKVGGRSVGVYAVNYPASFDFSRSASAGASDASAHVQLMAASCPSTKLVLGGHSQGAGVIDLIAIGSRTIWFLTPAPIPTELAGHVAAVAVLANPSRNIPGLGPLTAISPQYGTNAIDLCASGDPYCSRGANFFAHFSYVQNGMVDEAATFAASRL